MLNFIECRLEAFYTIPPKSNTKEPWDCDWWLYKERHLVECFFNKIKHFRRVATRFDKLVSSFMSLFALLRSGFYQNDQYFDFSDTP